MTEPKQIIKLLTVTLSVGVEVFSITVHYYRVETYYQKSLRLVWY
jgi:hypothetical protein